MLQKKAFLVMLLALVVGSSAVLAAGAGVAPGFKLSVHDELVSLQVQNGSMVEVVEQLGTLFGFEVIANLREDVRVNAEFEDLELSSAIREICASVGYVEAPDPETGKIARLVLVSGGGRSANRAEARREPLAPRQESIEASSAERETPDAGREAPDAEAIREARSERSRDEMERQREAIDNRRSSGSVARRNRASRGDQSPRGNR